MTTAVQHRRGTTAEHATFTGLEGEVTIDTTKDTAVIHDGILAGGVPLARENLANVTPSGLATIDGASTAADDKLFIYDQSATTLKSITRAELNNAMEADALANVTITGGTINGTIIGGSTAAAGTFTSITNTGGTANGVTYLNGSKVLASGSALTFDGTNFGIGIDSPIARIHALDRASSGLDHLGSFVGGTGNTSGAGAYIGIGNSTGTTRGVRIAGINTSGNSGAHDMVLYTNAASTAPVQRARIYANGDISFYEDTGTTPKFFWDASAESLGVGTNSPAYALSVVKNTTGAHAIDVLNSTTGAGSSRLILRNTSDTSGSGFQIINNAQDGNVNILNYKNSALAFWTNATERLRIDSSGNLGLGVTPSGWGFAGVLQSGRASFYGDTGGTEWGFNTYYNGGYKYIASGVAATKYQQAGGIHYWSTAPSGSAGGTISFTQAMTLTADGNLGVGTTSPSRKLTVAGDVLMTSASDLQFIMSKSGVGAFDIYNKGTTGTEVGTQDPYPLLLKTNNTVKATLDSSGNLGLGVTPSAWGTGTAYRAIDIGSGSSLANMASTTTTDLISNAYYSGSNWIYKNSAAASKYRQSAGSHDWSIAPSGTAGNAISFTQAMTLDASGNLGVGTSSPAKKLEISGSNGVAARITQTTSASDTYSQLEFYDSALSSTQAYIRTLRQGATAQSSIAFATKDSSTLAERVRIDSSGNLLVGATSTTGIATGGSANEGVVITSGGQIQAQRDNDASLYLSKNTIGFSGVARFAVAGSIVGSITVTASSTAYNTSSDYRLKEDWVAVADASTRVNALKPVNFAWKVDGSRVDGFLAHELAEVVPEAVTGEKDAVDAEGNPVYQGIDQSKLVPLLTAALQEALAKIESLTARVSALEGN